MQGVLESYEELLENIDDVNKITANDTFDLIEELSWVTYKCEEEPYFRIDIHGNVLQVDEKHIRVKTTQQVGWCGGKVQFKFCDMFTFLTVEEISSLDVNMCSNLSMTVSDYETLLIDSKTLL